MTTKKTNEVPESRADVRSTRLIGDDLLEKLIEAQSGNRCKCACCDQYESEIEKLVLDALGVPADNTVETNACDIANETGVWPEGAYCRDWAYEKWYNLRRQKKPNAKKFIAHMRRLLAKSPIDQAHLRVGEGKL